jgi:hypothetical protein
MVYQLLCNDLFPQRAIGQVKIQPEKRAKEVIATLMVHFSRDAQP